MEIIHLNIEDVKLIAPRLTLCLGYFDGLHLGHQKVINEALMDSFGPVAVVTFSHAPGFVSKRHKNEMILMDNELKAKILEKMGVSYLLVLEADERLIKMNADQFIIKVLSKLKPVALYCGPDYRFGYLRMGDTSILKKYFKVKVIDELKIGEDKISSTRIIRALENGELEKANTQLGRNYAITGIVVKGKRIGTSLGFPTANISVSLPFALPKNGVYITKLINKYGEYFSITNIGNRPTFGDNNLSTIETHVPDFSADLYGEKVELAFVKFIRDEEKFNNPEDLKEQISRDLDTFNRLVLENTK